MHVCLGSTLPFKRIPASLFVVAAGDMRGVVVDRGSCISGSTLRMAGKRWPFSLHETRIVHAHVFNITGVEMLWIFISFLRYNIL